MEQPKLKRQCKRSATFFIQDCHKSALLHPESISQIIRHRHIKQLIIIYWRLTGTRPQGYKDLKPWLYKSFFKHWGCNMTGLGWAVLNQSVSPLTVKKLHHIKTYENIISTWKKTIGPPLQSQCLSQKLRILSRSAYKNTTSFHEALGYTCLMTCHHEDTLLQCHIETCKVWHLKKTSKTSKKLQKTTISGWSHPGLSCCAFQVA